MQRNFIAALVWGLLCLQPGPAADAQPLQDAGPVVIRDLRLETGLLIGRSRNPDPCLRTSAVLDLCCLHDRIVFCPSFAESRVLAGLRARIVARLNDEVRRLRHESTVATSGRQAGAAGESGLDQYTAARQSRLAAGMVGGPAALGGQWTGWFAPGDSYRDDLIQLIVFTVNPDRWRGQGGDASISWWEPGLVLVVTADQETQDRIEALLIGLRGR